MANVDWDSKVVIGNKARIPTVTKKATDLNGKCYFMTQVTFCLLFSL